MLVAGTTSVTDGRSLTWSRLRSDCQRTNVKSKTAPAPAIAIAANFTKCGLCCASMTSRIISAAIAINSQITSETMESALRGAASMVDLLPSAAGRWPSTSGSGGSIRRKPDWTLGRYRATLAPGAYHLFTGPQIGVNPPMFVRLQPRGQRHGRIDVQSFHASCGRQRFTRPGGGPVRNYLTAMRAMLYAGACAFGTVCTSFWQSGQYMVDSAGEGVTLLSSAG